MIILVVLSSNKGLGKTAMVCRTSIALFMEVLLEYYCINTIVTIEYGKEYMDNVWSYNNINSIHVAFFGFVSELCWRSVSGELIGLSRSQKSRVCSTGVIIQGLAVGMLSTASPVFIIICATLACIYFNWYWYCCYWYVEYIIN